MRKGLAAYVMIALITLFGLVNFFAPLFTNYKYKTDPFITYFFLFTAGTIAGVRGFGVGSELFNKFIVRKPEEKPKSEEME